MRVINEACISTPSINITRLNIPLKTARKIGITNSPDEVKYEISLLREELGSGPSVEKVINVTKYIADIVIREKLDAVFVGRFRTVYTLLLEQELEKRGITSVYYPKLFIE